MKRPLMLTRYEVSCLKAALGDWGIQGSLSGGQEYLSASQKAAATRLLAALNELATELDEDWRKPRVRL